MIINPEIVILAYWWVAPPIVSYIYIYNDGRRESLTQQPSSQIAFQTYIHQNKTQAISITNNLPVWDIGHVVWVLHVMKPEASLERWWT
jgi:hypothetical protein